MNTESAVAIVVAIIAIVISTWQTYLTRKAIKQDVKFEEAETVRHFTQLYFQFVENHKGPLTSDKLKQEEVANPFWSLLSTEYYFYHEGAIPSLIFASWIVDVAEFYKDEEIWKGHCEFLKSYRYINSQMTDFFDEIYKYSKTKDEKERHNQIKAFVELQVQPKLSKDLWS